MCNECGGRTVAVVRSPPSSCRGAVRLGGRVTRDSLASVVLLGLMLAVGSVAAYLAVPARDWVERAPAKTQVVGQKLDVVRGHFQGISEVSEKVREMTEASGEDEEKEGENGEGDEEGSMIAEAKRSRSLTGRGRSACCWVDNGCVAWRDVGSL